MHLSHTLYLSRSHLILNISVNNARLIIIILNCGRHVSCVLAVMTIDNCNI
jgi:hypothetical protein